MTYVISWTFLDDESMIQWIVISIMILNISSKILWLNLNDFIQKIFEYVVKI